MSFLLRLLLAFMALCFFLNSFGQNSLSYTTVPISNGSMVADANGNVIDLNSATNVISNNSSGNSSLIAIGFEFYFMGKGYTHFFAGQDGEMDLAISTTPSVLVVPNFPNDLTRAVTYPVSTVNGAAVLAPFWDDLAVPNNGFTIRTVITGTAPNRCRVIGWTSRINTNSITPDGVFQVRIYESTGVIEYLYGAMAIGNFSGLVTASIGFSAGQNDGQFLALQSLTSQTFTAQASLEPATQLLVNSATPGIISALNSSAEGTRKGFRFSPPILAGSGVNGVQITNIGATAMTVNWNDNYSNEIGFLIYKSTDNINFTLAGTVGSNTTSFLGTGLTQGATYYWKVMAFTEGSASSLSASASGTTGCGLSGTYQIGPGGQYTSLSAAASSLKTHGMIGSILFEILPGYNSAGEIFPITFPKRSTIPCMTSSMTVTVRPAATATSVLVSGFTTSSLILLDCDYLTIDGRPGGTGSSNALTLNNLAYSADIVLVNASKNLIRNTNCVFTTGTGFGQQDGLISFVGSGSPSGGSDSNQIISCNIYSATATAFQRLITSKTIDGAENNGNQILDCNLYNFSESAISLTSGNNGWMIQGNSIYTTVPVVPGNDGRGIYINTLLNSVRHVIAGNYFGGTGPQCSGNAMQVNHQSSFYFIEALGNCSISQNHFKRIAFNNNTSRADPYVGIIQIASSNAASEADIVENEFGGPATADSISVTQNFLSSHQLYFYCVNRNGRGIFSRNKAMNIRCYSPDVNIIMSIFTSISVLGLEIDSNNVGDPGIANSIVNFTKGNTIGMDLAGAKVRGNIISRITAQGTLTGMDVAGDSVLQNEVFHLHSSGQLIGMIASGNDILSNKIHSLSGVGSVTGMTSAAWRTERNVVYGLNVSGTIPISLKGISALAGSTTFRNNMVRLGLDSLGNNIVSSVSIVGIGGPSLAAFNTVVIAGSNVQGSAGSFCYSYPNVATIPTVRNNIFINQRTNASAGSAKHYCVGINYTPNQSDYCNYNLYYAPGPDNYVGAANNIVHKNIQTWTSSFNFDASGRQANPLLVDPLAVDAAVGLHLSKGSPAESMGANTPITIIANDYDAQIRSDLTPVDVGADAGDFVKPFAGSDTTVCGVNAVQLGEPPSPNLTYSWSSLPAGFNSSLSNPVVSPASTTTYIVEASNAYVQFKDTVVVTVLSTVTPSAAITASATSICSGQTVTFNSTITNGGTTPSYQWKVNGINVGSTSAQYSTSGLINGSQVQLIVASSISCANPLTASSNTITINVTPSVTPGVSMQASQQTICAGQSVNFTATPVNGGPSPAYQWLKNGQAVGSGNSLFTTSVISDLDQFKVQMTSNAACATTGAVLSNVVVLHVSPVVIPSIGINGITTVTTGQSSLISSTVSNGGNTPSYQWQDSLGTAGWTNIASATNPTINYASSVTGVKLRCLLTSNANCVTVSNVTSNSIQFTVSPITAISPVNYPIPILSPNPANSFLVIQPLLLQDKWGSLEIQSVNGQEKLLTQNIAGLTKVQVDVTKLASGSYVLFLTDRNGRHRNFIFIKM
jgi:hypothetical protein